MSRLAIFTLLLLACLAPGCAFTSEQTSTCDEKLINASISQWINDIKDYSLVATIRVENSNVVVQSYIKGKVPEFLRVKLKMTRGDEEMIQKLVFDGDYQWLESNSNLGANVVKARLDPLTDPNRPFDTSLYLSGTGLFSGEDFPSTLDIYRSIYAVKVKCIDSGIIRLTGNIIPKALKAYIEKSKYSGKRASNIEQFTKTFNRIRMDFDATDYSLLGYALGKQDDEIFHVRIKKLKINSGLTKDDFRYLIPEGVEPKDITDQLRIKNLPSSK